VFFNPFVLLLFIGFYGFGALLIREFVAHKELNYISVLLLGAAYGVLEEGIILRSWFDPNWMLGAVLSHVLRIYDITVLLPFANIVYHAVVSILTPVLIVNSLSDSKDTWFSKKTLKILFILFIIAGLIIFFTFNFDYQISVWHYLLGFLLFTFFIILGVRKTELPEGKKLISPSKIWLLSSIFVIMIFVIFIGMGGVRLHWVIIFISAVAFYAVYFLIAARIDWQNATNKHYFASGAGFMSGLIPILALSSISKPENVINLIGALMLFVILIIIYLKYEF